EQLARARGRDEVLHRPVQLERRGRLAVTQHELVAGPARRQALVVADEAYGAQVAHGPSAVVGRDEQVDVAAAPQRARAEEGRAEGSALELDAGDARLAQAGARLAREVVEQGLAREV